MLANCGYANLRPNHSPQKSGHGPGANGKAKKVEEGTEWVGSGDKESEEASEHKGHQTNAHQAQGAGPNARGGEGPSPPAECVLPGRGRGGSTRVVCQAFSLFPGGLGTPLAGWLSFRCIAPTYHLSQLT